MATFAKVAEGIDIPDEGLSMLAFSNALKCHHSEAEEVIRYLHNKGVISMETREGYIHVLAGGKVRGRGRPSALPFMDYPHSETVGLLADLTPNFFRLRLLMREDGPRLRPADAFARGEVTLDVEADQVLRKVRRFQTKHAHIAASSIREALWIDRPDVMTLVATRQPELGRSDKPFSKPQKRSKNVEANLSNDERIYLYVEAAGENGIAAYEIARKFGGVIDTEAVVEIGTMLENSGMIHTLEVRKNGKGRITFRFFGVKFKPQVDERGAFFVSRAA